MKLIPIDFEWRETPHDRQVRTVLDSWAGTPYREGERIKGKGVDCVNFAAGFLDEMRMQEHPTEIRRLRGDRCLSAKGGTQKAMKAFLRAYDPMHEQQSAYYIEPGDLAVTGVEGPGHVLIAGATPNTWYHAVRPRGIVWTGSGRYEHEMPWRIYRYMKKKECWQ